MNPNPDSFSRSQPGQREAVYVTGYFALLTLVFSWPVIAAGEAFYPFDILNQFLPWAAANNSPANNLLISDPLAHVLTNNQLLHEGLNAGHIPYWNPWLFGGVPFEPATNPVQVALLYFLNPIQAHDVNLIVHLFASGIFFYWWVRQRGLMMYAAVFGGTAWMFNGYLMVWFEWEFATMTAAMLPLVLVAIDRCQKSADTSRIGFLALALSLLISAGFYQLTVYCAWFVTLYVIFDHFSRQHKGWRDLPGTFNPIVIASLVAIVVSLPYFIPKLDSMLWGTDIQRPRLSFEQLITIASRLEPAHLFSMLFPNLFSNPAGPSVLPFPGGQQYMYNNFNELCLYCGVPVTVTLCCIWVFRFDNDIRFFGILSGFILLMLAGTYLYYPLFILPGLDLTTPNRLLFIFGFSVCTLAAILFDRLFSGEVALKPVAVSIAILILGISLLSAALLSGLLIPEIFPTLGDAKIAEVHALLLANTNVIAIPFLIVLLTSSLLLFGVRHPGLRKLTAPLLTLLLAADLIHFGSSYNTKGNISDNAEGLPKAPMIEFLKAQPGIFRTASYHSYFLHNYLQAFHLEDLGGYLSVFPKSYAEFVWLSQDYQGTIPDGFRRWLAIEHLGHPLLSMAGMKYFVGPAGARLAHPDFKEVYSAEVSIFENSQAFERVYFVCNADYLDNRPDLFAALANADIDLLKSTVLISGNGAAIRSHDCESAVSVEPMGNGDLSISLAANQEGFLVIANQHNRHWQLQSPGQSWPLLRANHTFMASIQPPGVRQLKLTYQPRWHQLSYEWSIALWLIILVFLAARASYRLTR